MSYVLKTHAFWAKANHARRLDEVARHLQDDRISLSATVKGKDEEKLEKPKRLMEKVEQERVRRPGLVQGSQTGRVELSVCNSATAAGIILCRHCVMPASAHDFSCNLNQVFGEPGKLM